MTPAFFESKSKAASVPATAVPQILPETKKATKEPYFKMVSDEPVQLGNKKQSEAIAAEADETDQSDDCNLY